MKWIVGVSIFVATALGFVATTTIPAATITPDEATLKYFPPETEAIGFVDVASLRDVPLVHDFMFQGPLTSVSPEIGGFVDSTGFDVRRDLDNVMIGRSGRDHLVVASARYDKFKAEQFLKDKGCVKDINSEKGGLMRAMLDRSSPLYRAVYRQRTSAERINSQAKARGIERPKVRQGDAVRRLNTLTYIVINLKALARARAINASLLTPKLGKLA